LARFQKIYDAGRQSRPETSGLHEKEFQEERIAKSLRRFEKAHEAGQQSRLETSGRQKGSTSGSKIPELDNKERPTPVLWAWIYSMMLGVSKSLHDEITQIKKNEISRFVANLASSVCRSMGHEVRVRTNELTSPESSNSFKEFAHLLWSVNSKFVRVFVPSEEDYYGAQFNLQEWVLKLFAPSEGGEASILKVEVAVSQTEKAPLTDVIIRALFAKYSIPAYYIVGKMKKYPLESIFPKQVLLTEAVVDAMMLYYKSQTSLIRCRSSFLGPTKWHMLFDTDYHFVLALQKIQKWHAGYDSHQVPLNHLQRGIQKWNFFPWNQDIQLESMSVFQGRREKFFSVKKRIDMDNYVRKIIREDESEHNDLDIHDEHIFKKIAQEKWQAISRSALMGTQRNEVKPSSSIEVSFMLSKLEIWRKSRKEEINQEFGESSYRRLKDGKWFSKQAGEMLQLIYRINFLLIHNLGHPDEDIFRAEQGSVQNEFYYLLTGLHSSQPITESKGTFIKRDHTQRRILTALNYDDDKSETERHSSEKDTMMTKAAVLVIFSYYFKSNPAKFVQIFVNEEMFVKILARFQTRHEDHRAYMAFMRDLFHRLKSMELFPWKNYYIKQESDVVLLRRSFQMHAQ
jgi:hypothetical protein